MGQVDNLQPIVNRLAGSAYHARLPQSCLEKEPKRRLQAIGDWRLLLEEQAAPAKARAKKLPWIAGVLAVALGVALWGLWRAEKPVDRPLVRLDVDLGADVSFPAPSASASTVAISPDGTRLVYASGAPTELFTRRLDQPKATEISGTQGANTPFFSPDGQWIGFRSGSKLNKISVEGGAALPLVEISYFAGASWGEDGNVIVSEPLGRGLLRVPAGGGPPQIVAALGNGEVIFLVHRFCPEAKRSCLRLSLRIAWIDTRLRFSRWPIATGRSWPGAVHLPDIWQRLTGSAI